jgi:hypothetical protein
MKKRSILHSPHIEELKKRKRRILRNKILFFIFCFLLILIGSVFLSRWKKLNIENIQISGNKVIESQSIEKIVKENLSGHYLWFFPKTNFLLYPKKNIQNKLADQFKRLSEISIKLDNIKTLEINVTEREAKYTWCGAIIPELNNNEQKCYFIDSDGYIFDEAPYFSGNVYFRFYGNDGFDAENPSGTYFLKDKFIEITAFEDALEKLELNPMAFYLDKDGEADILLSSESANGPKIIFKIDSDYQKMAENLQAAISTEPLQTKLKSNFSSLLYIDLRFGNKVYYKFNE